MDLEYIYDMPLQYCHIEEPIVIDARSISNPINHIVIGNNIVCAPVTVYIFPIKVCLGCQAYDYLCKRITTDDIVRIQHPAYHGWTIVKAKEYHGGETYIKGSSIDGFPVEDILNNNWYDPYALRRTY